jgi:hypothetical protein
VPTPTNAKYCAQRRFRRSHYFSRRAGGGDWLRTWRIDDPSGEGISPVAVRRLRLPCAVDEDVPPELGPAAAIEVGENSLRGSGTRTCDASGIKPDCFSNSS